MTATTHICLLSEQPTPNICALLDKRIGADEAVFVVTEQQRPRLEWLKDVLGRHQVRIAAIEIVDAYGDTDATQGKIEQAIETRVNAGTRVLVNVTGGTKPMAIAAHMAAYCKGVPAFYVNDNRVTWLYAPASMDMPSVELQERLKLEPFLLAHGVKVRNANRELAGNSWIAVIDELMRNPQTYASGIRALNRHASGAERTLRATLSEKDIHDAPLQTVIDFFVRESLMESKGREILFKDEATRFFCAGGWLEEHVFQTVRDMVGELKPRLNDYQRSVEVDYLRARTSAPRNEMDVAVLYDNTLHIIECKTRHFGGSAKEALTEALYKLATLKRELGGLRSRALLVSYQAAEPYHRERAALLGIEIIAARELKELGPRLRKWLQSGRIE